MNPISNSYLFSTVKGYSQPRDCFPDFLAHFLRGMIELFSGMYLSVRRNIKTKILVTTRKMFSLLLKTLGWLCFCVFWKVVITRFNFKCSFYNNDLVIIEQFYWVFFIIIICDHFMHDFQSNVIFIYIFFIL